MRIDCTRKLTQVKKDKFGNVKNEDLRVIVNKFICLSVNMGIEVQIEISVDYIAIWENLTQKCIL